MGRQQIDVTATTNAAPDVVYSLLRDGSTWPTWSPLGSFELEREGGTEREGLDAIRAFRTGRICSRERIVELVPNRRLSYALESGLPLRGYRADVDLEPTEHGTTIHWRSSFEPKVPGTGWFYRRVLANFIGRTARGLAEHAARSASAAGLPAAAAVSNASAEDHAAA
jgi:Polyketide cyclase / dehydrase and lipid transport